ncbi:Quinolinate synthase, chloroplastic, partial [Cucurbita argyrosperma subsp. argyrosperma]
MESSTIMASRATTSSVLSFCSNPNSKSTHVKFLAQKPPIPFFETHKCIQSLKSNTQNLSSRFACSAATLSPSSTTELVPFKLHRLIEEFESISEPVDRVKRLLRYASLLPPYSARNDSNRVMGCTAQVWLEVRIDQEGKMRFAADSDSEISKGFCSCLISVLDGALPEDVLRLKTEDLVALNVGLPVRERSRVNTWYNVLISMQKRTKGLIAELEGKSPFEAFPSLVVSADGIHAKGSYAEAQARYLFPNDSTVKELVKVLKEKKIGVVAHFYMDPEVQGVLTAARKEWPHIYISDSLVMADMAVKMAKDGCQFVAVLGVDFMSENVRAILDQAGFGEVGVYRMSDEQISCSLADAAATPSYMSYLEMASREAPSLHVIYINTSLETKAYAHELVPTITCTSSNVMQTILQAFAQVPELNVWYGPDSYMGANIEGTCIVHHLFGHEVVEKINEMYCDAFLTAHFEVPGEMFALAMEAKRRGMGIVGSTQNILDFIIQRVQEALDRNVNEHLQFVLGTESGMITSIVAAVRNLLSSSKTTSGGAKINVEIVFPVSSDSVTSTSSSSSPGRKSVALGEINLPVVPGVSSGEGCSIHGGCASCPYMKMNSLSSLMKVCQDLPHNKAAISAYEAKRFKLHTVTGKSVADIGCQPILHMRDFQAAKQLPEKLVHQIMNR